MHNTQSLLTVILESIFVGFGIVIPILSLIRTSNLKTIEVKDLFVLTGVQMVRVAGIFYFLYWIAQIILAISEHGQDNVFSRIFGPYWWAQWYTPVMILALTQLFWIKKLYMKKAALITFALMLLLLPWFFIYYVKISVSSETDFVPPTWEGRYQNWGWLWISLIYCLLNIVVFIFITFTIILAGGKLKKRAS